MEWKDRGRRRGRRDRSTDEEATGECARAPRVERSGGSVRGAALGGRRGRAPEARDRRVRVVPGSARRTGRARATTIRAAGQAGGGGGGREGGGADEPESGAPRARTRRVSVSRDGVARDATRRSIGGAARDEAGRDAPRAVRELLVGARHVPRGGRPVAHDRHPARGARASRWNAARSERRPTDDQGVLARAKGRFAQTEHHQRVFDTGDDAAQKIFCARARGAEFGERFVLFSYDTNTVNTAKLVLLAPRLGVPSRGLLAMMVSIAARTLALAFSLAPSRSHFLARAVSAYIYTSPFIRAPPPHSPSHASGLGLVADSVRSTTGVAPYMNTPSTYVSASSSPGS